MSFINFVVENWSAILVAMAIILTIVRFVVKYFNATDAERDEMIQEQIDNMLEWLVGACADAEKDLGGGTGALKLRRVYDRFVVKFAWLATEISFEEFSTYVDQALQQMKVMLENNEAIKAYVTGK
jgi:hypothetical protein